MYYDSYDPYVGEVALGAYSFGKDREIREKERRREERERIEHAVFHMQSEIDNAQTQKRIKELFDELKDIESAGYDPMKIRDLKEKLKTRTNELIAVVQGELDELYSERQEINSKVFCEDTERLKQIDAQSDQILLRLMLRLTNDKVRNSKVLDAEFEKSASDRATATALLKLVQVDNYRNSLNQYKKEQLIERTKSQSEKCFDKDKKEELETVDRKIADRVRTRFLLSQTVKHLFPEEKYYFQGNSGRN